MDKKISIYTIGSFGRGWRDRVNKWLPNFQINDPRNHPQSSIAHLVNADMNAAMNCKITFSYIPRGKRAGTMTYAEAGASHARGQCLICVDKNEKKDPILSKMASHQIYLFQDAIEFLKSGEYQSKFAPITPEEKTISIKPYQTIMMIGDHFNEKNNLMKKLSDNNKNIILNHSLFWLQDFSKKVDLLVTNFKPGSHYDPKTLFFMGVAYATKIPIISIEGNDFPYPPLLGLARRVFTGEKRFEILEEYLKNLKSQHIEDEALVCYNLFKKFNSE